HNSVSLLQTQRRKRSSAGQEWFRRGGFGGPIFKN
ncbi:hypothetical protein OKW45_003016, partial [Paraburkholderia sp. WSM4175]